MVSVFLCHSSKDKPFVRQLGKDLEFHGIQTWIDENEIKVGDSLSRTIEAGLEKSDYVIVVLSRSSVESPWVQRELGAAYALETGRTQKVILPVLIERSRLPLLLQDKKYADFSEDYQMGLKELLDVFLGKILTDRQRIINLSCSIRLDILRLDGGLVKYTKNQVLKCINGEVGKYVEALQADGRLERFCANPGKISNITGSNGFCCWHSIPREKRLRACSVASLDGTEIH